MICMRGVDGMIFRKHGLDVLCLSLVLAMATTACASSQPAEATQATQQAGMDEARLGPHRFRMPVEMFRYGIAPQGERRFEMMLRLPGQSPLAVEPAPGSLDQAMLLSVEVVRIDGVPVSHMLSFWLRETPLDASPDPLDGDVKRMAGDAVHGLRPYFIADGAPSRGDARDRFLGPETQRPVPSFIECMPRAQPDGVALVDGRAVKQGEGGMIATCDHAFLLEDDLAVHLRYARVHLPQWRGIESRIAARLREAMAAARR
jgi:hypothetical protein